MAYSRGEFRRAELDGQKAHIVTMLQLLTPLDLALFKAKCPDYASEILDSPELTVFWTNHFNSIRLQRDPSFQFRDPSPQSRADFYCGYVLYLGAMKEKGKSDEKYRNYLLTSVLKFSSFHAYKELLITTTIDCKKAGELKDINMLYHYITDQSTKLMSFKTPGCLLIANTYFYLSTFYEHLGLDNLVDDCVRKCWTFIHLAGLFEPYSETQIHNAYFGKGLKMSNPFGLSTPYEMKRQILELFGRTLSIPVQKKMETDAMAIFKEAVKDELNNLPVFHGQDYVKPKI